MGNRKMYTGIPIQGGPTRGTVAQLSSGSMDFPHTHFGKLQQLKDKYCNELGIRLSWNQFWGLFFKKNKIEDL